MKCQTCGSNYDAVSTADQAKAWLEVWNTALCCGFTKWEQGKTGCPRDLVCEFIRDMHKRLVEPKPPGPATKAYDEFQKGILFHELQVIRSMLDDFEERIT